MKTNLMFAIGMAAVAALISGCATPIPPGAERGPDGTMAYHVLVEASSSGVRIEADGKYVGEAPVTLKIFGDPDGTFHDFGDYTYEVRAIPSPNATNEYIQTRSFQTGRMLTPQDKIPERIYFQMNQPPPRYIPYPVYVTPPAFYDPFYYDPFYYRGPSFRFHYGPRYHYPYRYRDYHRRW